MTIASSSSSSGDGFSTLLTCPKNDDTLLFIVFAVESGSSSCEFEKQFYFTNSRYTECLSLTYVNEKSKKEKNLHFKKKKQKKRRKHSK